MAETTVIAARALLYIVALGLAGVPLYLRIAGSTRAGGPLRTCLAVGALAAAAISIWWAAASIAAMAAMPLADLDYATFSVVADATPIGTVLYARLAACVVVLLLLAFWPRTLWLGLAAAAISIAGAWTGHAGAAEGDLGHVQRFLDSTHLFAAAIWFGALLTFLTSLLRGLDGTGTLVSRLERFAGTGTAIVAVLAITGAVNGWLIAKAGFAVDSTWSLLLIAKLVLFVAMLGLASLNRWIFTPAYKAGKPGAAGRLGISLSIESACAAAIFALVAVIGISDPGGMG